MTKLLIMRSKMKTWNHLKSDQTSSIQKIPNLTPLRRIINQKKSENLHIRIVPLTLLLITLIYLNRVWICNNRDLPMLNQERTLKKLMPRA